MKKIFDIAIILLLAFILCGCSSSQAFLLIKTELDTLSSQNAPERVFRLSAAEGTFPMLVDAENPTATGQSYSIVLLTQEPPRRGVVGFAVRSDGAFAVLQECRTEYRDKIVAVYNDEGQFLYGISFTNPGASGVDFDADALRIWSVRGDCTITVDEQGNVLRACNALDANAFDTYWNEEVDTREHIVGNSVYRADNAGWFCRAFANDCGRISVTENGETRVLYLADTRPVFQTYDMFLGGVIFAPAVLIVVVMHAVRENKRKQADR